jgi:hypothetical protein
MAKKKRTPPPRSKWFAPHPLFPDPEAEYQRGRADYLAVHEWAREALEALEGGREVPRAVWRLRAAKADKILRITRARATYPALSDRQLAARLRISVRQMNRLAPRPPRAARRPR